VTGDRWADRRERSAHQRGADADLVRQLAGHASRFADVCGHDLDVYDVLAALDDTGLLLIRDGEGFAGDARRWAVLVIAADPLDVDPAVDSHFDRERDGREEADQRRRRSDRPDSEGNP
jgi:hypothetical protein